MKAIHIPILLLIPVVMPAQDYQNICSPGIVFYRKTTGPILAFRLDSIDVTYNPDTTFYSYRAIRYTGDDCLDTTSGCILGLKITKKPSGIFQLYNKDNSTVTIHTSEGLGYSWTFYTYPSGDYIVATIVEHDIDSLLEMVDSVKVILFQAKDYNGNNIAHILNGQQIKLSKHFGLTRMLDVYSIPSVSEFYTIVGKTDPPLGMQNMIWNEIYDFSVGDEFHFHGTQYTSGVYVDIQVIKKVLEKEEIPDSNRIIYTWEWCQRREASAPPPNIIYDYDTLTEVINFSSDTSYVAELPLEFKRIEDMAAIYSRIFPEFNERQTHKISDGVYFTNSPPCWNPPFEYSSSRSFAQGLGRTRYSWSIPFESLSINLVHFKKGAEEWGNPIAPGCNILLSGEWPQMKRRVGISVFPNPVEDKLTVILEGNDFGDHVGFTLIDPYGREVFRSRIMNNRITMDRPPIPDGIYIWKVTGTEGTATGKLLFTHQ